MGDFERTSSYDPNSPQAILGTASEIVAERELNAIAPPGFQAKSRTKSIGPMSAQKVIDNSQNGDLDIMFNGVVTHTIEVKSSLDYPNASIDDRELAESSAKYLLALTRAGVWACTMEAARKAAIRWTGPKGKCWLICYDRVDLIPLEKVFK